MSRLPSLSQQHYTTHQSFDITPDYYLHIHTKSLTHQSKYCVDLFDLDLHPSTHSNTSRPLLVVTLAWGLISLIVTLLDIFQEVPLELMLISSVLTLMFGLLAYFSRKTAIIYHHRLTQQALFEILVFSNNAQRDAFVKRLNALLLRLSEYDRPSFYAQQANKSQSKDGLSYN
jgi:hypothetical protein